MPSTHANSIFFARQRWPRLVGHASRADFKGSTAQVASSTMQRPVLSSVVFPSVGERRRQPTNPSASRFGPAPSLHPPMSLDDSSGYQRHGRLRDIRPSSIKRFKHESPGEAPIRLLWWFIMSFPICSAFCLQALSWYLLILAADNL